MKKDQLRIFAFEILLVLILFFALFALNIFTRSVLALIISIYAVVVICILKTKKISSINKKQVTVLMIIFSMFYLAIFYAFGLYFGFVKSKILFSLRTIFKYIIPITLIIVGSETIRRTFLLHKVELKIKDFKIEISGILTYISMVIIDLLIYTEIYSLRSLDDYLTLIGFVFFASLSCNLLYNYITPRYGSKGIIIYRLVTTLFVYILPFATDMYIFFRSFLRMLYPYIMYLVIERMFTKNDYSITIVDKRKEFVGNTVLIVVATLFVMLISCQFKYGLLVVGSESMTGTLNKGDAVIFERYDDQIIKEGQVIIFNYNDIQTIHRVVDIRKVNGEYRYYTKGDANQRNDDEYRTEKDISSLVKLRVKYIGYPTLWVRSIFAK